MRQRCGLLRLYCAIVLAVAGWQLPAVNGDFDTMASHAEFMESMTTALFARAWIYSDALARASFSGAILNMSAAHGTTADTDAFRSFTWPLMISADPNEIKCKSVAHGRRRGDLRACLCAVCACCCQ